MSETTPESTPDGNDSGATSAAEEFKAITSQEDLDRIVGSRVKRAEAKFKDYDDLKAKAAQLDSLSEASKTDLEREKERATALEADLSDARAEALRLRVAVEHGITIEDADLFLTGKDEGTLTAQAKRLSDREADRKKSGPLAPREGQNPKPNESSDAQFARSLLGGN